MKTVIVGGVAGGASCAARLRRLDENAQIVMFERGEYISFANCGLPYHIGGIIEQRDNLLLQTPESFHARFNVDVRTNSEVKAIDRKNKTVTVLSNGREYQESYDFLVLSPGSSPLMPAIPGIESSKVLQLWNIPDMDAIIREINQSNAKTAVVVGGGFIGLEMAENLVHAGLDVTLIEMVDQVMTAVDYEMAQILHSHMAEKGVKLALSECVERIDETGTDVSVTTDRRTVHADFVICAAGVRPNTQLASGCGLKIGESGGIAVDESLRTEDEAIYAVGDAVEITHYINGQRMMIPLAGPANKMGRMAADNICGLNRSYKGTQGSIIAKVFDLTVAATGLCERQLKSAGMRLGANYKVTVLHPLSHAGYYPGGMPLALKLIFTADDGRVLGAQAVGYNGVDKRIDVIAAAIRFGATVFDLEEIELCYAPPYASAKDPVNMAGYTADNLLSGLVKNITFGELAALPENAVFLDVRTAEEYDLGTVPGSLHIPVDNLRERLGELDNTKEYIVFCAVGIRSYAAARILKQHGFAVRNLAGGFSTYRVASRDYTMGNGGEQPVEKEKSIPMKAQNEKTITVNACGLQCPGPVIKLYEAMKDAQDGDVINIISTDPGFFADASAWCARTKNTYLKGERAQNGFSVWIKKGQADQAFSPGKCVSPEGNDKSIIVFSGDLDKAMASFIIANGAAAMGRKVTMFFTFWGLNILRRRDKVKTKKTFIERMFGAMMPRGTQRLKLSKMNMLGMGSVMMRGIMKKKNVASLDELIDQAKKSGVVLVACTMSMDVMGIKQEELIDGITLAGVASYLGAAESSDTNLFI